MVAGGAETAAGWKPLPREARSPLSRDRRHYCDGLTGWRAMVPPQPPCSSSRLPVSCRRRCCGRGRGGSADACECCKRALAHTDAQPPHTHRAHAAAAPPTARARGIDKVAHSRAPAGAAPTSARGRASDCHPLHEAEFSPRRSRRRPPPCRGGGGDRSRMGAAAAASELAPRTSEQCRRRRRRSRSGARLPGRERGACGRRPPPATTRSRGPAVCGASSARRGTRLPTTPG